MNARESRFLGNSNSWTGEDRRYRGWKLICSECRESKIVQTHKDNLLPPNIIVKKFITAGWIVGKREDEDKCPRCIRKPRAPIPPVGRILQLPLPLIPPPFVPSPPEKSKSVKPKKTRPVPLWCKAIDSIQATLTASLDDLRNGRLRDVKNGIAGTIQNIDAIRQYLEALQSAVEQHRPKPATKQKQEEKPKRDADYQQWLSE